MSPAKPFPKLPWITVCFTYLLMFWGNMVSATGSGLACPDWPMCRGTLLPPLSFEVILEWGHRLLAATTSTLIVLTLLTSVLRRASNPNAANLRQVAKSLIILIICQILLGGLTVKLGLSIAASTIHLIVASTVFAGMITVASVATWGNPAVQPENSAPNPVVSKMRRLSIAGLASLLIQVALGGLVRHGHAGLACPSFPGCMTGFLPDAWTFETTVAFAHRWWGFVMLGLFVHLAMTGRRLPAAAASIGRVGMGLFLLSLLQVLLGIGVVHAGLPVGLRSMHAATGYALWGGLFFCSLRSGGFQALWKARRTLPAGAVTA